MTRNEMNTPDGAVATVVGEYRRLGAVREYVVTCREDLRYGQELIPAASLDALRGELEFKIALVRELLPYQERAIQAEAKLAAVGAAAEELMACVDTMAAEEGIDDYTRQRRDELRTLIAEAGTGDNDNSEVTR